MGIARFYRWMAERYPQLNQLISDVSLLPEFDNLYLDMNGIIHQCTHPSDGFHSPTSQSDQMLAIFAYLDRIVSQIVKPQKVLILAIDGVAPRAKLNQQRSRRFRAGKELMEERRKRKQAQLESQEEEEEEEEEKQLFDSNCITPGTEFMANLSKHLVFYIQKKITEDPIWQNLTVIFSGHEVPGEGEHKIMDYIRSAKSDPSYDPNTRHCLYGSDADLMLLGLMTHDPHFTLLREVVDFNSFRKSKKKVRTIKEQEWQLVHLSLFREYLMMEMEVDVPFYDPERALDDFIFLTFLLGNDFIPHSPTLEIGEDAIAVMFDIYKANLPLWGGFLTQNGQIVDTKRLLQLFQYIGDLEEQILTDRKNSNKKKKYYKNDQVVELPQQMGGDEEIDEITVNEMEVEAIDGLIHLSGTSNFQEVKLSYYNSKFGITLDDADCLDAVLTSYVEALIWCLGYYFQGPPCWSWFYPFHYAPMISDLTRLSFEQINSIDFSLTKGQPLLPFQQLMSTLPASSANLLPEPYQFLLTNVQSPIVDFYPVDFDIDMNGKRNPWEGVNLLPFIDTSRLIEAVNKHCPDDLLTAEERQRNQFGHAFSFHLDFSSTSFVLKNTLLKKHDMLKECYTVKQVFLINKQEKYESKLLPGLIQPLAGFPSFRILPVSAKRLENNGTNIFGMASKKKTLVLYLNDELKRQESPQEIANKLVGEVVYVNYPHLHEASCVGVSTEYGVYNPKYRKFHPSETQKWQKNVRHEQHKYWKGCGIIGSAGIHLEPIKVMVHVVLLQGMIRDLQTGAKTKKFGQEVIEIPYDLVYVDPIDSVKDPRFQETPAISRLRDRFPMSSQVVIIDEKNEYFGRKASVIGYEDDILLKVEVDDFQTKIQPYKIHEKTACRYYFGWEIAKRLRISPNVLGRIVSNLVVGGVDIGLNLKHGKSMTLLGYCRLTQNVRGHEAVWQSKDTVRIVTIDNDSNNLNNSNSKWEYSEDALNVLHAYLRRFPVVFQMLDRMEYEKKYELTRFFACFSTKDEMERYVKEIEIWLGQLDLNQTSLCPVDSVSMSKKAIKLIDTYQHHYPKKLSKKRSIVRPEMVFCPQATDGNYDVTNMELTGGKIPALGDRVVNLTGRNIPFGLPGTVVTIHQSSHCVEVVFDKGFAGGSNLGGNCSPYRGKLVPWHAVLKISKPPTLQRQPQHSYKREGGYSYRTQHIPPAAVSSQQYNVKKVIRPPSKDSLPPPQEVNKLIKNWSNQKQKTPQSYFQQLQHDSTASTSHKFSSKKPQYHKKQQEIKQPVISEQEHLKNLLAHAFDPLPQPPLPPSPPPVAISEQQHLQNLLKNAYISPPPPVAPPAPPLPPPLPPASLKKKPKQHWKKKEPKASSTLLMPSQLMQAQKKK